MKLVPISYITQHHLVGADQLVELQVAVVVVKGDQSFDGNSSQANAQIKLISTTIFVTSSKK